MTAGLGLAGRSALLTDATSAIGSSCVQRLCEEGMTVAFTAAERASGEALAAQTGASFIECDHRDHARSDRAVEEALKLGRGRLDVLVTCGGSVFQGSIEDTPEAVFRDLLESNLTATFRVARACFAAMRAQGHGAMVHIASDSGIRAAHETAAHSVMSAGVIATAELVAAEGAAYGIRSNAVCPRVETDVASIVAWLASDESRHVSGATLRVDDAAGATMAVDTRTA